MRLIKLAEAGGMSPEEFIDEVFKAFSTTCVIKMDKNGTDKVSYTQKGDLCSLEIHVARKPL